MNLGYSDGRYVKPLPLVPTSLIKHKTLLSAHS